MARVARHVSLCLALLSGRAFAEEAHEAKASHEGHEAKTEHDGKEEQTVEGEDDGVEEVEHEIAIDMGFEQSTAFLPTIVLSYGFELGNNEFVISGALAREDKETVFADASLGYYRTFDYGWLKPLVGFEVGVLNRREVPPGGGFLRRITPLERIGAGAIHEFSTRYFAGIIVDVAFSAVELGNFRSLVEIGVKL